MRNDLRSTTTSSTGSKAGITRSSVNYLHYLMNSSRLIKKSRAEGAYLVILNVLK